MVPKEAVSLEKVFQMMEENKERLNITDWAITNTTLEEVFLRISKETRYLLIYYHTNILSSKEIVISFSDCYLLPGRYINQKHPQKKYIPVLVKKARGMTKKVRVVMITKKKKKIMKKITKKIRTRMKNERIRTFPNRKTNNVILLSIVVVV